MTYLQLTDATADTARLCVPDATPLAPATLCPSAFSAPSLSSAALAAAQRRQYDAYDALVGSCRDQLRSIATFADAVTGIDAELGKALQP